MSHVTLLGIETSCDETAAAVAVEGEAGPASWEIRSSVVASQVDIHREWGGVVPELASRQHVRDICGVVERALRDGRVAWADLDAVAVTQGPGLVGSLLVGVAFAKALAVALDCPLVPVHHLAGHIESLFLCHPTLPLPAVVLVVSGGHTSLYHLPRAGSYQLIGRTRDDAAGEAFDKVAKLLGLAYPGGPCVDRLARRGNERAIRFPVARMTHANRVAGPATLLPPGVSKNTAGRMDLQLQRSQDRGSRGMSGKDEPPTPVRCRRPSWRTSVPAFSGPSSTRCSTAHSRRYTGSARAAWVSRAACRRTAGCGRWPRHVGRSATCRSCCPPLHLSTDNAAMIAVAGLRRWRAGVTASLDLNAEAGLVL